MFIFLSIYYVIGAALFVGGTTEQWRNILSGIYILMRIACSKPKRQYKIYILYAKFIVCQGEMLWRNLYKEVEESKRGRYFGCEKGNSLWPGGIKAESSLRWENHPQGRVSLENRRISTRPSEVKMCSQRWRSDNEAGVTGFYSACYRKFMEPF